MVVRHGALAVGALNFAASCAYSSIIVLPVASPRLKRSPFAILRITSSKRIDAPTALIAS